MTTNPWKVDSLQAFSCLKCPECPFFTKEENTFANHAITNHPLSKILFEDKNATIVYINEELNFSFAVLELFVIIEPINLMFLKINFNISLQITRIHQYLHQYYKCAIN